MISPPRIETKADDAVEKIIAARNAVKHALNCVITRAVKRRHQRILMKARRPKALGIAVEARA